jgi:hypothetical protein
VLIIRESTIGAISAYHFIIISSLLLPCIIILFLHLLSTNHKGTQPCYFPLLLKPAAHKEKMDCNSSTKSSRLCVAPVAVPVELWSLALFHFIESRHSLLRPYLCNNHTLFVIFGYLWTLLGHMCEIINHGSCIWWVHGFSIKIGYDSFLVWAFKPSRLRFVGCAIKLTGGWFSVGHASRSDSLLHLEASHARVS